MCLFTKHEMIDVFEEQLAIQSGYQNRDLSMPELLVSLESAHCSVVFGLPFANARACVRACVRASVRA